MPVWTAADIIRFSNEGEDSFATDYPCIIDRVALSIVSGTSEYTLSDAIINIRRVTWKGQKLEPLPHRYYRDSFPPVSASGRPFWYVYNNVGQSKIKLFPTPNETITSTVSGLFTTAIRTKCIVEYFRTSDNSTYIIPSYLRRRLLKAYVLKKCFSMENQGQNLKASKYFIQKWNLLNRLYSDTLNSLSNKPRKLIFGGPLTSSGNGLPGSPLLPIARYGVGVNTGE